MTKLVCMRGYSGSGKSTRAQEIAKEIDGVVVNRDLMRKMLLGEWWTGDPKDEDRVTLAEESQVGAFLRAGTSVVVDATHLNPAFLRKWARLATRLGVEFEVADVEADVTLCRQRDHARMLAGDRYVGDKVIAQQAKRFPRHKWPTVTAEPFIIDPVEPDFTLPDAYLFDIDGTLAYIPEGGRSNFDYTRVGEDLCNEEIQYLNELIYNDDWGKVIVMSGRDDTCYEDTRNWLYDNGIQYHHLFMRPTEAKDERGNKLPDYQVKYHLFNEHIRGKFNVRMVFDDRTQVVEMWRKLGLRCLQVAPGDF